ncbi:MAG: YbaN family protein [Pseudomonadota bacterium]
MSDQEPQAHEREAQAKLVSETPVYLRPAFLVLGVLCVALGVVGVIVPGMPTTIFLIVALWAFARSSPRFHQWLLSHPRFGPGLRDWSEHRIIPRRAKIAACLTIAASFGLMVWIGISTPYLIGAGFCLLAVAVYLLTRPSERAL